MERATLGGLTLGPGFSNGNVHVAWLNWLGTIPPASNLTSNHRSLWFDFLSKHLLLHTIVTTTVFVPSFLATLAVTVVLGKRCFDRKSNHKLLWLLVRLEAGGIVPNQLSHATCTLPLLNPGPSVNPPNVALSILKKKLWYGRSVVI